MKVRFFVVIAFVTGLFSVYGQSGDFAKAIALHDQASIKPDARTIEQAKLLFDPFVKTSAVAQAYVGSLITMEASIAAANKNGIKALGLLDKGGDMIDKAVKAEPNNADLHFLRMINGYGVTIASPVNRFKVIKQDIDWLDARKTEFTPALQGTIELYKGLYLAKSRKLDDALEAFDACIAISPGSPEALEAARQIATYSE